ncbi:hypothetical protein RvY_19011 [Ramazzottius varieornatus]|uniref:Uncharacterized protein n=1 Tax=Ramazzottius varieornatus TaxID=947166 RepID=A0A1D1W7W0_RAMVA|nr:hypothetical protein RvY_19011 [Ramazzottius varieornatus]
MNTSSESKKSVRLRNKEEIATPETATVGERSEVLYKTYKRDKISWAIDPGIPKGLSQASSTLILQEPQASLTIGRFIHQVRLKDLVDL